MLLLVQSMETTLKQIFISLDTVIYDSITWMYSVFMSIAGARIFSSSLISEFVNRVYLIISIAMLFIVVYSFLMVIINPDNFSKGNSSPLTMIKNIVLSLIIIIIVPSIFSFGFAFQKSVVRENVIGKIVLGSSYTSDSDDFDTNSAEFSVSLFETNFYVKQDAINVLMEERGKSNDQAGALANALIFDYDGAHKRAVATGKIKYYADFITSGNEDELSIIQYNYIICGLAGIFALYSLLIFSIDMGLRVIKLFFYEMVAPIPALLMIIPGQDKMIKTWTKQVLKTYFDVFLKIVIITFGFFVINVVGDQFTSGKVVGFESSNESVIVFAKLFIFLGVIMFMRRAPKLVEELLGFKLDENGFSLKKRLDESGVTALLGAAGGMAAGAYASARGAASRGIRPYSPRMAGAIGSGLFHGARLGGKAGWNGSLRGIGDAHTYAQDNQAAWGHMKPNRPIRNGLSVAGEMLRDNVGMRSYYDSQIANKEIEYNKDMSGINRAKQSLSKNSKSRLDSIEKTHRFDIRKKANDYALGIGDGITDIADSEIQKEGYLETTNANILTRDADGNISFSNEKISGSQIEPLRKMYADALNNHEIDTDQHRRLVSGLDEAKKRLKADYISNNNISYARDQGMFKNKSYRDEYLKSYAKDYVKTMSSNDKKYEAAANLMSKNEKLIQEAKASGDTAAAAKYQAKYDEAYNYVDNAQKTWLKQAETKFNRIIDNPDDYKTNLSLVNKVQAYNDAMNYTGDSKVGATADGMGVVDSKIKSSLLGTEIIGSIKALHGANDELSNTQQNLNREVTIVYTNESGKEQQIMLGQVETEFKRLEDLGNKKTDDLKAFKAAHYNEEQASKVAKEMRSHSHPPKSGGK